MAYDIISKKDVRILVDTFYESIQKDRTLAPLFIEVLGNDWEPHLVIIREFWYAMLLGEGLYTGNLLKIHQNIRMTYDLEEEMLDRWLSLWKTSALQLFEGEKTQEAILKADQIGMVLRNKLWPRNDLSSLLE